jgi:branched-chain amino acid aminotransferase
MALPKMWFNGKLMEAADVRVDFLTAGLHYGIGVFEGIRCYANDSGPAIFRLDDHIARLCGSAKALGWRSIPWTHAELVQGCIDVVRESGFSACYIRPLIYLAEGGWNLTLDNGKPHCGIAVWEWKAYLGEEAEKHGVRANVSSFTRHHPNVMMTKAKVSGNYASSVLAKTESLRLGFDEAIMLDPQGFVAECTGENLFLVKKGKLRTSPDANILDGITRNSIMELAGSLGYQLSEGPISRDQLYMADEVFVCGTAAEVVGLREIDFRTIGSGTSGPVTQQLQAAYHQLVRGKHAFSEKWLTPVK